MVKKKSKTTKSRTKARPAPWYQKLVKNVSAFTSVFGYIRSGFLPAIYVFSVLILFQFVAVRIALGFSGDPDSPSPPTVALVTPEKNPTVKTQVSVGLPIRLKIPNIRVNAAIRAVGLTANGSMGVPALPRDAAWYQFGPRPGEIGSAAIAGHINWWYGATGVFAHLSALKVGDVITIQDDKGMNTSFIVRATRLYGQKEDSTDVFRSTDGKAHLNLITCAGVWDKAAQAYSKRLVVFADKVTE